MNSFLRPAASFMDFPAMVWKVAVVAVPAEKVAAWALRSVMELRREENDAMWTSYWGRRRNSWATARATVDWPSSEFVMKRMR